MFRPGYQYHVVEQKNDSKCLILKNIDGHSRYNTHPQKLIRLCPHVSKINLFEQLSCCSQWL